jgi:hypothetical protein
MNEIPPEDWIHIAKFFGWLTLIDIAVTIALFIAFHH